MEVTCAVIVNGKKVLACQHGSKSQHPFRWEFPGGKIERGETAESCIVREITEELNARFTIIKPLAPIDYQYPNKSIRLIPFLGSVDVGSLRALEHIQLKWFSVDQLDEIDWVEADRLLVETNKAELLCCLS